MRKKHSIWGKLYLSWIIAGITYITSTYILIYMNILIKWLIVFIIGIIGFIFFERIWRRK